MNMEKSYDYQAMIDSADQVDLAFELRKTTTLLGKQRKESMS